MNNQSYFSILVPAMGLLVPFIIRWIENRSRLKQAQHLLQIIKTRDEIDKILQDSQDHSIEIQENEEERLRYYRLRLEKEIGGKDAVGIRLYPVLISFEIIFFVSAVFAGMLDFFKRLIYAQGNQTLPFLEGIFSVPTVRIGLLVLCLSLGIYFSYLSGQRIRMKSGNSIRTELLIFGVFNLYFLLTLFVLGLLLYLLDMIMPWF